MNINELKNGLVSAYVPKSFHWPLFALGEAMIVAGAIIVYKETRGETTR